MQQQAIDLVRRRAEYLKANRDFLTIDADVHATDVERSPRRPVAHYYHGRSLSAEEIAAAMDAAGVSMANVWQNPASTGYPGGEDANADALLEANRYIFECGRRHPERFIPSGWTDPRACGVENACRIAETCVREFGFAMVKLNPAQNRFPMNSPAVTKVVERIVELGAIPAFHFGADSPYTPAAGLEAVARAWPEHPVVAVHMGGGGAGYLEAEQLYHQARELGLRLPNIRYVFSAIRDSYIEEALIAYQSAGPPFSENLFCGSDAPYGSISWNFGGFRAMFRTLIAGRHHDPRVRPGLFTPEAAQNYLGGNFARLMAAGCERLLGKQRAITV